MKALSKRQKDTEIALRKLKERGRPPKPKPRYTKSRITTALRSTDGFVSYAAASLGCTEQTLYNAFKRWPDLKEELNMIREGHIDMAEHSLIKQVKDGNTAATIFMLKCLAKKRGYIEQPQANLHLHAEAGSGTWADILDRQIQAGRIDRHTGEVVDAEIVDGKKQIKA